jgi:hypothetical protein
LHPTCRQGVGVALFDGRTTAEAAVEALSGRQADGRRLDLLVMSPDNHISFSSCKVEPELLSSCTTGAGFISTLSICSAQGTRVACKSLQCQ